jgi:hypothetical protein
MTGKTIEQLAKGDYAQLTRTVREAELTAFVDAVTGSVPSLDAVADGERIAGVTPMVPSTFAAALVATVIGTELPGPGTSYVSQTFRFLGPVREGDTITAHVGIVEILRARNAVCVQALCTNQAGDEVLAGEAWVMPPAATVAPWVHARLELVEPVAV